MRNRDNVNRNAESENGTENENKSRNVATWWFNTPMYSEDPEGKAEGNGNTNEDHGEVFACQQHFNCIVLTKLKSK